MTVCVAVLSVFLQVGDRPTARSNGESREQNLRRYNLEPGISAGSKWALGVHVIYTNNGAEIYHIYPGMAAEKAGLVKGDVIMEVDSHPIGKIRDRIYTAWENYKEHPTGNVQLTIASPVKNQNTIISWTYYYPQVQLSETAPVIRVYPELGRQPNEGI